MTRALTIMLISAGLAIFQPAHAQSDNDEAAIRAIVADQEAAWNKGDGTGYARSVSADVSFTNLFGMVMYGAPAFTARHRQILSTFYRGTTKRQVVRRIRFITPDVAIVDIDNELTNVKIMPPGLPVPASGSLKTQLMEVFARRGGRWLVEAYHNVDVKEQGQPSGMTPPQRLSEQLYYLDPYQTGAYSCTKKVAKKQSEIFGRRFNGRIDKLKRKEALVFGHDPGFDAIALGHCSQDRRTISERFIEAMRKFDVGLTTLEQRWH